MADYLKARDEAKKIWMDWNLTSPPVPIIEIAESFGLTVRDVDFGERQALSGILDIDNKKIYLNNNDSSTHKRFTVAHELGHWILHKELIREDPSLTLFYRKPIRGEEDNREKEANCFAANILVPLQQLALYANKYSDFELARFFAVSKEVIGYRRLLLRGNE
ncbi:MAG: ImmA/IrrE family metallo-endopeptidase [Waddliaceae bacterium]